MMKFSVKKTKGVITVLVSLMLVGVLSVGTLVLEAGRFQAAKTQLTEANTSAATSMIASYNGDLYDRFGLLAIDKKRFTSQRAIDYLNYNSDTAQGYTGNKMSRLYSLDSVQLYGMYNLTDTSVLKRQVLSRAKYHVNTNDYALNIYTYRAFFADFQNKCLYVARELEAVSNNTKIGSASDVPNEMTAALNALYGTLKNTARYDEQCDITLSNNTLDRLPSVTGTVKTVSPEASAGSGEGEAAYSEIDVDVAVSFVNTVASDLQNALASGNTAKIAEVAKKIRETALDFDSALNMLLAQADENMLLNSYITEFFSNRNNTIIGGYAPEAGTDMNGADDASFVSACVEYVIGSNASERENQKSAYNYVQMIRLITNLYAVLTDSDSFDANNMYSAAAHILWADYESIIDTELLTTYNFSVPFNKNTAFLPLDNMQSVADAFSLGDLETALSALGSITVTITKAEEAGWDEDKKEDIKEVTLNLTGSNNFSYRDSLLFALWFVPNSEKLLKVADLVQLEMRYKEAYVDYTGAEFLMSEQNTYCGIKSTGKFNSILPVVSFNAGQSVSGTEFESIRYAGY